MLETLFRGLFDTTFTDTIAPNDFLLCVGVSLLLGLLLCGMTMWHSRFSRSLMVTLAILPAVVCVVIMMVNGNVGTGVAVAGAFNLVRFRSAPSSAWEIAALFVAMGTGLITGMGYLGYGVLFTVILGTAVMVYNAVSLRSGAVSVTERTLHITIPEDLDYAGVFEPVLAKYTRRYSLTQVKTTQYGQSAQADLRPDLKRSRPGKELYRPATAAQRKPGDLDGTPGQCCGHAVKGDDPNMKRTKYGSIVMLLCALLVLSGCGAQTSQEISSALETSTFEQAAVTTDSTIDTTSLFSERDLEGTYDESAAIAIQLDGDSTACDSDAVVIEGGRVTIEAEGTYLLSGTLTNGQIVVDVGETDKVQLVLAGADIASSTSAAIYAQEADKVFATLAEGKENTLTNGGEYVAIDDNNIDAVIFAKTDLTLNGSDSLTINAQAGHEVVSKDDLTITGGSYTVNGGTLELTCNSNGNTALDCDGTYTNNGGDRTTNDGSEENPGQMGGGQGGTQPGGGRQDSERPDNMGGQHPEGQTASPNS